MSIKAYLTVWEGDDSIPPEHLGEYEFRDTPRINERITIPSPGPWWDILLVLSVEHRALKSSTPEIGRYEPSIEIFARRIGETDDS